MARVCFDSGRLLALIPLALAAALGLACGQDLPEEPSVTPSEEPVAPQPPASEDPPSPPPQDGPLAEPRIPQPLSAGPFAPALTTLGAGAEPVRGRDLLDADSCGSCHEAVVAMWRSSAHAFASFNNPIYRASIDRFREQEDGPARSQFCAGCHDPALLVDGAMRAPVDANEARAHVGVACRSCHGVESSLPDGNGSYVLASTPLPIPDMKDPQSIVVHREAMNLTQSREQCISCHRAFIGVETGHPHHLNGTDEPGPWRDSSYAGNKLRLDTPVSERHCVDCHMPREIDDFGGLPDPAIDADGGLRSHRFLGGHSWLAAMRGDAETLGRVQAFLQGVASVDIAAVELGGHRHLLGEGLKPAQLKGRVTVDLVVRNLAVGHRFPGGTRDAQDTWLSLRVLDRDGRELASLDETHGQVHRLRTGVVDGEGKLVSAREVERLRAVAFDHTIGPRDAVVVRYAVALPEGLESAGPLRIEARLLHRSRTLELADLTCAESKSKQGRAFLRASERLLGQRLDPCVDLPVTEVARHVIELGSDSTVGEQRPAHERLWELGLALGHQVQERLPEAREALDAALDALDRAELPQAERDHAQARILAALGSVAARQGRVDEAVALADRVEALVPGHPYPVLVRGRALANV
ncbi:MAG: hypothetical protein KC457_21585, partial [Myxococcales bacterium]|nr:hypothetical protein [Myxococcales bacterium]